MLEEVADEVADFEASDLPERAKVALRFADAIVGWPRGVTPELRRDLRRLFTEEQILELALDVLKWSNQKQRVALATDAPDGAGRQSFEIDPTSGAVSMPGAPPGGGAGPAPG